MKKKLSVAIIAYNEEDRLPDCLRSVFFADDIVVVDSGSTDRTVHIAKSMGTRVINAPWRGFSAQKQLAVNACRYDWVLILDADERIPPITSRTIMREIQVNNTDISAFSFRRKNYLGTKWIRHCGWWPDRIVRLVNRNKGIFDKRSVHEKWITEGKIKSLDAYIEHLSFRSYSDMILKMDRYSTLAAKDLMNNGARASALSPLTHGLWMFFKTYILEKGIFEGFEGILISLMNAIGSFFKYAKLREMKKAV